MSLQNIIADQHAQKLPSICSLTAPSEARFHFLNFVTVINTHQDDN